MGWGWMCVCGWVCGVEGGKCTERERARCSRGWGVGRQKGTRPTQGTVSHWKWLRVWSDGGNVERWWQRGRKRTNFAGDLVLKVRESKSYSNATESFQKVLKQSDTPRFSLLKARSGSYMEDRLERVKTKKQRTQIGEMIRDPTPSVTVQIEK